MKASTSIPPEMPRLRAAALGVDRLVPRFSNHAHDVIADDRRLDNRDWRGRRIAGSTSECIAARKAARIAYCQSPLREFTAAGSSGTSYIVVPNSRCRGHVTPPNANSDRPADA